MDWVYWLDKETNGKAVRFHVSSTKEDSPDGGVRVGVGDRVGADGHIDVAPHQVGPRDVVVLLVVGQVVSVQEQAAFLVAVDNEHKLVLVLTVGVLGGGERIVRAVLLNGRHCDHRGIDVLVFRGLCLGELKHRYRLVGLYVRV